MTDLVVPPGRYISGATFVEYIIDAGPAPGAPDYDAWHARWGPGPAKLVVFSARELAERDKSGRYTLP